ncbi:hypothetical protein L6452_22328 [Arctium lappa]|uniref:Uncharacterized protein n=1 Tax=Arctium lappa TaxID=4217 RepID=A0ACB9AYN6_ARCLA|nr:hypothetical protein L6452_22328 [Arctium lappa]
MWIIVGDQKLLLRYLFPENGFDQDCTRQSEVVPNKIVWKKKRIPENGFRGSDAECMPSRRVFLLRDRDKDEAKLTYAMIEGGGGGRERASVVAELLTMMLR